MDVRMSTKVFSNGSTKKPISLIFESCCHDLFLLKRLFNKICSILRFYTGRLTALYYLSLFSLIPFYWT